MREVGALIVGGGPSGLAVAYALQGDTLLLEKESRVGGLCRSIQHRGGVFDIGGHSFHTPHPEVYDLVQTLLPGGLFEQQREAWVYSQGTLIPYPFQKFFDRLPNPEVVRECEEGLKSVRADGPPPQNFEDYIVHKFGEGIAKHFMLPYNRKLWARDITKLSCDWTSERVAGPKGKHERFDTSGGERRPLQADTTVGYPRAGGYEEIYASFVRHIPEVRLRSEVVRIDTRKRVAFTADGRAYRWQFLVSTMPLPILLRVVDDVPRDIQALGQRLDYLSLRVEMLLTTHPLETSIQRIYVPEPEIPAHKIALNHNSSDSLRARPHHAIMAEVSVSSEKHVEAEKIASQTVDFLCDVAVLRSRSDICWKGHLDVEYAYPVYTHDRLGIVSEIKAWMAQQHIYPLGRFGDWEYINSDRCLMKGLTLGKSLLERYADVTPGTPAVSAVRSP